MTRDEAWAALENDCDVSSAARYLASVIEAEAEAERAERERCARIARAHAGVHADTGNTYGALACGDVAAVIRKGA